MFRSFFGLLRSIGFSIAGIFNVGKRSLDRNPEVIRAKYDDVIRAEAETLKELDLALSEKGASLKNKKDRLKKIVDELEEKEKLKTGAVNMIRKIASQFSSEAELKKSEQYMKANDAFHSLQAEISQLKKTKTETEKEIALGEESFAMYKAKMVKKERELRSLRNEKHDKVADIQIAISDRRANDRVRGLDVDKHAEDLRELRELADREVAAAEISSELAGNDAVALENEFLRYAEEGDNNEFDELLNLSSMYGTENSEKEVEVKEESKLPE